MISTVAISPGDRTGTRAWVTCVVDGRDLLVRAAYRGVSFAAVATPLILAGTQSAPRMFGAPHAVPPSARHAVAVGHHRVGPAVELTANRGAGASLTGPQVTRMIQRHAPCAPWGPHVGTVTPRPCG